MKIERWLKWLEYKYININMGLLLLSYLIITFIYNHINTNLNFSGGFFLSQHHL